MFVFQRLNEKINNEQVKDVHEMRDQFALKTEDNFRLQMLGSIFSEYMVHLRNNGGSVQDIKSTIVNKVSLFINENKGYVNESSLLKVIDDELYKLIHQRDRKLKNTIQTKFITNVGDNLEKHNILDVELNSDFKAGNEMFCTQQPKTRTNIFCSMYYDECVKLLKNTFYEKDYDFYSKL